MVRHVRNMVSVVCVVACVLLVTMWVRSYHQADQWHGRVSGQHPFLIASKQGRITVVSFLPHTMMNRFQWKVASRSVDDQLSFPSGSVRQYESAAGFGWIKNPRFKFNLDAQPAPFGGQSSFSGAASGDQLRLSSRATGNLTSLSGSAPSAPFSFSGPASGEPFGFSAAPSAEPLSSSGPATVGQLIFSGPATVPLNGAGPIIPYYFLVLMSGVVFALSRLRRPWRFGTRSMMIAIAFVATVLALERLFAR